jgi:hypothetical protein
MSSDNRLELQHHVHASLVIHKLQRPSRIHEPIVQIKLLSIGILELVIDKSLRAAVSFLSTMAVVLRDLTQST